MSSAPPLFPLAPAPTLSLCMIVRDSERTLRQALASVQPFVEEVIVVDTGSTDGTREIAREFGAKLVEIPWPDSFAAARNCSLEQATGEWIFWMDSDDLLPPASGQALRRAIAEHPERDAAFWVTIEEQSDDRRGRPRVMGHAHIKLFPRRDDLRFCYRVHEQIAPAIRRAGLPILRTSAVVRHVTDRSDVAQQTRRERNLRLALLDLAEHPNDPFVFLSLGTTYLFLPGELPTSIEYLRRAVAGCQPGAELQLNSYLFLGQALGTSGDWHAEEQVYREALSHFPDDALLLRRLADLAAASDRAEEAIALYETLLQRGKVRPSSVHVRGGPMQAALRLGRLHIQRGQPQRAAHVYRAYLARHPKAEAVRRALAELPGGSTRSSETSLKSAIGKQNFLIVVTARNGREYLAQMVDSLAQQKWPYWRAVFVDDCSTDGTVTELRLLLAQHDLQDRFVIQENNERHYQTYNLYHAIKRHGKPDDVVAILDGDDYLAVDDALNRLAHEYDQGWEVVWSNWRGNDGSPGSSTHLNPFISPRRQPFLSSHFFSFQRRLFDAVTEHDMVDDKGQWFRGACDVAIIMPILDQTIKRRHIEDVLYIYNRANPNCSDWEGKPQREIVTPLQARDWEIIKRKRPKTLAVDQAFLRANLYEFLRAAEVNSRITLRLEIAAVVQSLERIGSAQRLGDSDPTPTP